MATIRAAGHELPTTFTNHFLAHLQVATAARFAAGKGFFLTTTVTDDGVERTVSEWLHPGVSVSFVYDVTDDSGDRIPPVELDQKEIDSLSEAMEQPNGVRGNDGVWWPFSGKP